MTSLRTSLVDVYVLRGSGPELECLALRRASGGRCPGSWESVHGHIEPAEQPAGAAARELEEETGLVPLRLYNLSRVELFYQHRLDEVALVPVFAHVFQQPFYITLFARILIFAIAALGLNLTFAFLLLGIGVVTAASSQAASSLTALSAMLAGGWVALWVMFLRK